MEFGRQISKAKQERTAKVAVRSCFNASYSLSAISAGNYLSRLSIGGKIPSRTSPNPLHATPAYDTQQPFPRDTETVDLLAFRIHCNTRLHPLSLTVQLSKDGITQGITRDGTDNFPFSLSQTSNSSAAFCSQTSILCGLRNDPDPHLLRGTTGDT